MRAIHQIFDGQIEILWSLALVYGHVPALSSKNRSANRHMHCGDLSELGDCAMNGEHSYPRTAPGRIQIRGPYKFPRRLPYPHRGVGETYGGMRGGHQYQELPGICSCVARLGYGSHDLWNIVTLNLPNGALLEMRLQTRPWVVPLGCSNSGAAGDGRATVPSPDIIAALTYLQDSRKGTTRRRPGCHEGLGTTQRPARSCGPLVGQVQHLVPPFGGQRTQSESRQVLRIGPILETPCASGRARGDGREVRRTGF